MLTDPVNQPLIQVGHWNFEPVDDDGPGFVGKLAYNIYVGECEQKTAGVLLRDHTKRAAAIKLLEARVEDSERFLLDYLKKKYPNVD